MQKLLTTKQVMEYFGVKDTRTIKKFIKQGLKVIPVGSRNFRFEEKDVEEFKEYLKEIAKETYQVNIKPTKSKARSKTINIDFEKVKANKVLNRVI